LRLRAAASLRATLKKSVRKRRPDGDGMAPAPVSPGPTPLPMSGGAEAVID